MEAPVSISRRNFLKYGLLSGLGVALSACQRPVEHKLVSQYQMPEYNLPGQALYWATSCGECAGGCGLAAKTSDGRLIKVEGLPEHPINRGKLCARGHSALQDVYHPNRLNEIRLGGGQGWADATWSDTLFELQKQFASADSQPLWVVDRLQGTRGGLLVELAQKVGAKLWVLEFPGSLQERRVIKALTGKAELPLYKLEDADYVVAFGGDFLNNGHSPVRDGWGYGQFRANPERTRGILISLSSRMNMTHANADRWLPVRPGTEGWVALAVGNILAAKGRGPWPAWAQSITLEMAAAASGLEAELIERLAERLARAQKPLIIADAEAGNYLNGTDSLYIVHALGKMLNGLKDTYEPSLIVNGPGEVPPGLVINTREALEHLNSGECKIVWVFDVDPMTLVPRSLGFDQLLGKVPTCVAFASFPSPTTALCKSGVLPVKMWLEEWGDRRIQGVGLDVYNIQQPVVSCQWGEARSIDDVLMFLHTQDPISAGIYNEQTPPEARGAKGKSFHDLIRGDADDKRWETLLARGGVFAEAGREGDPYPNRCYYPPQAPADPGLPPPGVNPFANLEPLEPTAWNEGGDGVTNKAEFVLLPVATLAMGDGTLGNRSWLQELPDPVTTIVWGPWIEINSEVAREMKIERHDLLEVEAFGVGTLRLSAVPLPSLHREAVAIPIGDDFAQFNKWEAYREGGMDYGIGNRLYGPLGFTNRGFGSKGVNPRQLVGARFTAGGEPLWVGSAVTIKKLDQQQRVTAMDQRVFNLPRQILPTD